jgi:hypothetical protein
MVRVNLEEHSLGRRAIGSSNLPVPTIKPHLFEYRMQPHSPAELPIHETPHRKAENERSCGYDEAYPAR